jgi:prepilin-type N-terminal cleavage/methylation domain-containing protein
MKKNHGFTFIELMIAMAIFSILALVIYSTFFSEIKKYENRSIHIAMITDANRGMNALSDSISNAQGISIREGTQIDANGVNLIDMKDDGINNGSLLNLESGKLMTVSGTVIAEYVKEVSFTQGPFSSQTLGVMDNVILIQLQLKKNDNEYFLKGGVNIDR